MTDEGAAGAEQRPPLLDLRAGRNSDDARSFASAYIDAAIYEI